MSRKTRQSWETSVKNENDMVDVVFVAVICMILNDRAKVDKAADATN
jgi:hypothetical protein